MSAATGGEPGTMGTPAAPLTALVEELVLAGVRDVVVCPGSRSTPLALALRMHPGLRCWVHLDERAGAFFALGAAKASRRAVAVLVTSGSAAAELAPAIVEARHARVPLVALTADRPPELRDRGAPQAIDQDHLFGRFAKWYAELPVPELGAVTDAHTRSVVARAVATALESPAGPVQLNLPYREPLVPAGRLAPASTEVRAHTGTLSGRRTLRDEDVDDLAARIRSARHPVVVCGPLDTPGFAEAVAALSRVADMPLIADALSNVRLPGVASNLVTGADALLRVPAFVASRTPDLVLRFGGTPTSKALLGWLTASAAAQVVVDDGGWNEPTLLPGLIVHADPVALAEALAERLADRRAGSRRADVARGDDDRAAWLASWKTAEVATGEATRDWLDRLTESFEGEVFAALAGALPDGAIIFAGNSMPVRDLEAFLGTPSARVRCLGNRGANGIDGLVSTALGAAAVADGPVVAIVGDVTFLHDLSALVAARRLGLSATVVVMNNDGGGIFSFLSQAATDDPAVGLPQHFEELFGTPHGIDLGPLVRSLGAHHEVITTAQTASWVSATLGQPGLRVLEVRTERRRNVDLHRGLQQSVVAALERMG